MVAIALVHLIEKISRQIVRRSAREFRHEPPSQWNETSGGGTAKATFALGALPYAPLMLGRTIPTP
jgi:hypothetical protein